MGKKKSFTLSSKKQGRSDDPGPTGGGGGRIGTGTGTVRRNLNPPETTTKSIELNPLLQLETYLGIDRETHEENKNEGNGQLNKNKHGRSTKHLVRFYNKNEYHMWKSAINQINIHLIHEAILRHLKNTDSSDGGTGTRNIKNKNKNNKDNKAELGHGNNEEDTSQILTKKQILFGVIQAFFACILISFSFGATKVLVYKYDYLPELILLYRFGGILLLSIPFLCYFRNGSSNRLEIWSKLIDEDINYKIGGFIIIHTLCGIGGIISQYYALQIITLADFSLITSLSPVFVLVTAVIFLLTPFSAVLFFIGIIGIGGCFVVWGPMRSNSHIRINGIGLAVISLISSVITSAIIIKILNKMKIHWSIIIFIYGLIGCIISGFMGLKVDYVFKIPFGDEFYWIIGIIISSFIGYILNINYLKYLRVSVGGIIQFSGPIFLFLFEYFLFNEIPNQYSIGGGIIILATIITTSIYNLCCQTT